MDQSRVILIPATSGPTENCFEVPILDDSIVEDNEEFLVNFQIASGSNAVPGSVSSTCITIIDDDQGKATQTRYFIKWLNFRPLTFSHVV